MVRESMIIWKQQVGLMRLDRRMEGKTLQQVKEAEGGAKRKTDL